MEGVAVMVRNKALHTTWEHKTLLSKLRDGMEADQKEL
jgi:hypothetical protein